MGQGARCPTCSWTSSKVGGRLQVEQAPVAYVHPVAVPAVAVLNEGLREPHGVQEFEGARVDRHCPALPGRTVALVDDASVDPARQQLGR